MAFGHLSSGRAARLALLALSILTIIFAYSLIPSTDCAFAAQATVAWDPGTDPALAGYKVYWGTVSKNYSWSADTSAQTTYTVPSLSEGATYYFAATAYDAARTESGFSNEVTYTVPSACTYTISSCQPVIWCRRRHRDRKRDCRRCVQLDHLKRFLLDLSHIGRERDRERHGLLFRGRQHRYCLAHRRPHRRRTNLDGQPGGRTDLHIDYLEEWRG